MDICEDRLSAMPLLSVAILPRGTLGILRELSTLVLQKGCPTCACFVGTICEFNLFPKVQLSSAETLQHFLGQCMYSLALLSRLRDEAHLSQFQP